MNDKLDIDKMVNDLEATEVQDTITEEEINQLAETLAQQSMAILMACERYAIAADEVIQASSKYPLTQVKLATAIMKAQASVEARIDETTGQCQGTQASTRLVGAYGYRRAADALQQMASKVAAMRLYDEASKASKEG